MRSSAASDVYKRQSNYMVYIPPFSNESRALEELRVLRSQGVDSFVITQGERQNGVSLGIFGAKVNADAYADQIERMGFTVVVEQLTREQEVFSLNLSGELLLALPENYWDNFASRYPELKVEQKACIEVASAPNFQ